MFEQLVYIALYLYSDVRCVKKGTRYTCTSQYCHCDNANFKIKIQNSIVKSKLGPSKRLELVLCNIILTLKQASKFKWIYIVRHSGPENRSEILVHLRKLYIKDCLSTLPNTMNVTLTSSTHHLLIMLMSSYHYKRTWLHFVPKTTCLSLNHLAANILLIEPSLNSLSWSKQGICSAK